MLAIFGWMGTLYGYAHSSVLLGVDARRAAGGAAGRDAGRADALRMRSNAVTWMWSSRPSRQRRERARDFDFGG